MRPGETAHARSAVRPGSAASAGSRHRCPAAAARPPRRWRACACRLLRACAVAARQQGLADLHGSSTRINGSSVASTAAPASTAQRRHPRQRRHPQRQHRHSQQLRHPWQRRRPPHRPPRRPRGAYVVMISTISPHGAEGKSARPRQGRRARGAGDEPPLTVAFVCSRLSVALAAHGDDRCRSRAGVLASSRVKYPGALAVAAHVADDPGGLRGIQLIHVHAHGLQQWRDCGLLASSSCRVRSRVSTPRAWRTGDTADIHRLDLRRPHRCSLASATISAPPDAAVPYRTSGPAHAGGSHPYSGGKPSPRRTA